MNFVHFSAQNTSVKVEISNQVKCHTAQRSEARGGRAGPEAGRKMSQPSLKSQSPSAREVEGLPWGAGGSAPLQGSQELLLAGRGPGEGVEDVPPAGPAAGPKRWPLASQRCTTGAARARDPPRLPGQEGAGGSFLSSLSPPRLSVTRSPQSAPREAAAPRAVGFCPGQRYS